MLPTFGSVIVQSKAGFEQTGLEQTKRNDNKK
jgi:hypothetical protein